MSLESEPTVCAIVHAIEKINRLEVYSKTSREESNHLYNRSCCRALSSSPGGSTPLPPFHPLKHYRYSQGSDPSRPSSLGAPET